MPVKIFTIPFNEETQTFHDDLVQQFCVNKRVHKIDTKFFSRNHQPFWTVAPSTMAKYYRKKKHTRHRDTGAGAPAG